MQSAEIKGIAIAKWRRDRMGGGGRKRERERERRERERERERERARERENMNGCDSYPKVFFFKSDKSEMPFSDGLEVFDEIIRLIQA